MVAAGVPKPRPDHATAIADLALAMMKQVDSSETAGQPLQLRIGINSGPVVAGIIGRERFSYDLWGDAVNTASRMESHGQPGRIQISEATYELIQNEFTCQPRGTLQIKGKGTVPVWYLVGQRDRDRI
jgi:adenylate cyclase